MDTKITAHDIAKKAIEAANDVFEDSTLTSKEKADAVLQYVSAALSAIKAAEHGY